MSNRAVHIPMIGLLCAAALLLSLTACQGDEGTSSDTSTDPTEFVTQTPVTTPTRIPLTDPLPGGVTAEDLQPDVSGLWPKSYQDSRPSRFWETKYDRGSITYRFAQKTGEYLGFSKDIPDEQITGPDIDEEQAIAIAEAVLSTVVDLSRYEPPRCTQIVLGTYAVHYVRMVGGYESTECCSITLERNGMVSGMRLFNIGLFDGLTPPEFDETDLEPALRDAIDKHFKEDILDYKINDDTNRIIDYEDGVWFLQYDCSITFQGYTETMHARDSVFVPLPA